MAFLPSSFLTVIRPASEPRANSTPRGVDTLNPEYQKKPEEIRRFRKPSVITRLFQIALFLAIVYAIYWAGLEYGYLPETMRVF
jgi:hypothetical protein